MFSKAKLEAAAMWDNMVRFAQRLVQTPSISGEEGKVADLICDEMRKLGYDRVFRDSTGNVVGVITGSEGGESILYNFHMDHVSPGNLDAWEYPPYEGVIADGYLHGRGASDVKGAAAVQVYAAACLKRVGVSHRGDIIVTGVVDEEPGDMWGMRRLASEVLAGYSGKIGLVVLAEATGLDIYLGHRGRLEIELSTYGKIGHSSSPWRGVNAVYEMRRIIAAVEELGGRLPEHEFLGKSTICITNIKCSPGWGSIIPDKCTIFLDRRFLPSEDKESIINEIKKITAEAGLYREAELHIRSLTHRSYTGIEQTVDLYKPAFFTATNAEQVIKTVNALKTVGQEPKFGRWDFGTDGAWTAVEMGIPTIGYSPGEEQYAHTPRDRVNLELMCQAMVGSMAIAAEVTR